MKIKTKLMIEVLILVVLIGTVSVFSVTNTRQLQEGYNELKVDTLPALDNLRDMRVASTLLTSATMEILLLQTQAHHATGSELRELEEEYEFEIFEIENAKALFSKAAADYSGFLEANFAEGREQNYKIVNEWGRLVLASQRLMMLTESGADSGMVLEAKDEFEDAQRSVNQEISWAITATTTTANERQAGVEATIDETVMTVLITLNLFIVIALVIRFFILRSISKPLVKLRKATSEIAEGNFVKTMIKGNDEISDLGHDVDKMSEDLAELNKKMVAAERLSSIGSLASRVAHDLRNPLTVIRNSLEILAMKLGQNMDEGVDHQLAMVGRAVARMSHQIEDVMDFVNVADIKREPTSLITVVESAILSTDVPKSVKVNLPKNSATVRCDPYRLEVVLSNIIRNSCQAIEGEGEVTIRIVDNEDDALIEIEDSGPGISESDMPKIFEPLYTTRQQGTGLGLASCKSIVEKHGGTVTARNNPTTFTIQLPKTSKPVEPPKKPQENPKLTE